MKKVAVVGSFVVDLMARTPRLPEPGETVRGSFFKAGPGGKGANQAVAAKRAGSSLVFSTKLGADSFAEIGRRLFESERISSDYIFETEEAATGTALISVDETTSQNQIVVVPGACGTFTEEDLNRLKPGLEGCEYLLLQLEINLDATEKLICWAYRQGIKVILNPAPIQDLPEELYGKLYLVTPNEVEARSLTGISCDDETGCRRASEKFLEKGVENVIITLGSRGVYFCDGKSRQLFENYDVTVIDTTGAGDAFNGGILAGLSREMTLRQAAVYGNIVSNLAVTRLGTAPAMPAQTEIEQFIRQQGLWKNGGGKHELDYID